MIVCKFCGSTKLWKAGVPRRSGKKLQRWQCKDCGRYTTTPFIPLNKTKKELIRNTRDRVFIPRKREEPR